MQGTAEPERYSSPVCFQFFNLLGAHTAKRSLSHICLKRIHRRTFHQCKCGDARTKRSSKNRMHFFPIRIHVSLTAILLHFFYLLCVFHIHCFFQISFPHSMTTDPHYSRSTTHVHVDGSSAPQPAVRPAQNTDDRCCKARSTEYLPPA